jgi:DNA-directed RNA polymerase subunit H (RpoH/RPB5)
MPHDTRAKRSKLPIVLPQPTISKSAKEKSGLSVKIARKCISFRRATGLDTTFKTYQAPRRLGPVLSRSKCRAKRSKLPIVLPQPTISKSAKEKSGLSVKIARIFRMIVELVGQTVFLVRRENSPTERIPNVRGYGHTFPEVLHCLQAGSHVGQIPISLEPNQAVDARKIIVYHSLFGFTGRNSNRESPSHRCS